jgi:hypothetical protein
MCQGTRLSCRFEPRNSQVWEARANHSIATSRINNLLLKVYNRYVSVGKIKTAMWAVHNDFTVPQPGERSHRCTKTDVSKNKLPLPLWDPVTEAVKNAVGRKRHSASWNVLRHVISTVPESRRMRKARHVARRGSDKSIKIFHQNTWKRT